jgi:YD repeat-containing protein
LISGPDTAMVLPATTYAPKSRPLPPDAFFEKGAVLSKISSSDGRQLALSYNPTTSRLEKVTDNVGNSWLYSYLAADTNNSHTLSRVTLPSGETWQYQYQPGKALYGYDSGMQYSPMSTETFASRKIIKITFPAGGSVSYGYGAMLIDKGLIAGPSSNWHRYNMNVAREQIVSRTLSTGEKWKYTYTRGEARQLDTSQTVGPEGTTTYKFMGAGYSIKNSIPGGLPPPAPFENNAWKVGKLLELTQPDGSKESYTWKPREIDSAWFVLVDGGLVSDEKVWAADLEKKVVVRDGATYTTTYAGYDAYGNPGSRTETGPNGGNRTTTFTYFNDPTKWIIGRPQNETSSGRVVTRTYNPNGSVLTQTLNGVSSSYTYDTQGNLASKTLPGNRVHTYSNYKRGIPQTEIQPEGITITRVVDNAGNITSETNGESKTTRYTYDGLGRVTSKTPPLGNVETATYTSTSKTTKRGNLVETTQYDPFGRVASVTLGGITTRYEHDGLDRRTFVSDPGATTGTRYQYDALGRVTRVTNADTSYQAIAYGAATRTITDERRKATIETYRGYGTPDQLQLMAITVPEPGANVTLTRDAADRITSVKQGPFTRTYTYNGNGYLSSVTNPETGKTVYGRDVAGNMTTKQVGASGVTRYTYDGQNRLKSVTYPGTTPAVTNTYDKTGKLLTSVSTGGNRVMTYDAAGNLIQQSLTLDGKTFTAKYAYNTNDQLASITYPQSARVVNYTPDVLGRPTMVSGYVSKVTYWPSGMINQITYANGTTTSYTQTPRLWPATFTIAKTGGATYLNSAYTYDGTGNLATIRDTVDSSFNRTLGYDGINRLTSAAGFWGAGSISYDGVGNLLKQTYGTTSLNYAYDAQNRLASVSGQRAGSFTYDAYGNIVRSAGITYTYNDVPNLVCINCAVAASKVEYQYDAINQRSSVTKAGRKVYEMHDTDGKQLIELDGNTLTEYIYLGDKRIADRVSP